ncbi:hypothetical protein LOC68_16045 [Blastopirellula sp. JC732]|uniref:Carboxypeptidase regulatory-like domain-containing protein n=1 Tax=Blastopirellula sediminis TaxID=2894196 RepID=A0A9X1MMK5_9BACT|nr:hypothetical protein [Blastopirellula sediminis]MCC9606800.1 hypothetical protein [Blastopirellula sediminis]MCC9629903.1 hypothetical protein [Blastopirellula sediminis]
MWKTINIGCACAALLIGVVCLTGCGGDDGYAMVEGTVTLDGQPIENGVISLVPLDGETPTAGERIENGVYKMRAPLGTKRVEISASKVVGQRAAYAGEADSPQMDITKSIVPARYNMKSELTLDVAPGINKKDFDLKSK